MASTENLNFIHNETWLRADHIQNLYNTVKSNGIFESSNDKVLQTYLDDTKCIDCKNRGPIMEIDRDTTEEKLTDIQKFYHGKNVLITGGTGFLGKILIEKLLRSCPGVDNLYLLVRQKKGKDIYTRIDEMFDDPLFSQLKQQMPKFRHKVVVVPADCEAAGLGLAIADRQTLIEKINIVFHSAATVKFDEHLRAALATNVRAPLYLLELAKQMKGLHVFMHISTAYSNSHLPRVEERFYPFEETCDQLQFRIAKLTDGEIDAILPDILGPWPNTYTFTKALAEKELRTNCGNVPIGIFRPAIVTSTAKEPLRCWLDNMYGPTGVTIGAATGILRTLHCDPRVAADIVPVDMVVNATVAAADHVFKRYNSSSPPSEPLIYNYVSSAENRITWGDYITFNLARIHHQPFSNAVWYISLTLTRWRSLYLVYAAILHILPAAILDMLACVRRSRPEMLRVYKKVHKFSSVLSYFITREIIFCNRRTRELWENTSEQDKKIFPFSMATLDWDEYFDHYLVGIRRYMFKDGDDTLPAARVKWRRLHFLHQTVRYIFCFVIIYVLWLFLSKFF